MASNTLSRQTVREELATKVAAKFTSLFGTDWDVFNFKTVKFNGKARNIVFTSAGSRRVIMGADADESDPSFRFRIFVLVLHQAPPIQATNNPTAGANKVIDLPDTTNFVIGGTVTLADDNNSENATITAVVNNTSITVANLVNAYTAPHVYAWTPHNSDDQIDAAEKALADFAADNQTGTSWDKLEIEGETDPDQIVDEGGQTFRREIIVWRTTKHT